MDGADTEIPKTSSSVQHLFLPVQQGMVSGREGNAHKVDRLAFLQSELVGVVLVLDLAQCGFSILVHLVFYDIDVLVGNDGKVDPPLVRSSLVAVS